MEWPIVLSLLPALIICPLATLAVCLLIMLVGRTCLRRAARRPEGAGRPPEEAAP